MAPHCHQIGRNFAILAIFLSLEKFLTIENHTMLWVHVFPKITQKSPKNAMDLSDLLSLHIFSILCSLIPLGKKVYFKHGSHLGDFFTKNVRSHWLLATTADASEPLAVKTDLELLSNCFFCRETRARVSRERRRPGPMLAIKQVSGFKGYLPRGDQWYRPPQFFFCRLLHSYMCIHIHIYIDIHMHIITYIYIYM
jgi:hypothetical protein